MDSYIFMKDIRIYTLFSGSSGNCHYIKLGEREILIDAGKNAKAVTESLSSIGADIKRITDIYLTHDHSDHTSALRVLQKKNPHIRVHCHPLCREAIAQSGTDTSDFIDTESGSERLSDEIRIVAFDVPHDASACLGYRIEYQADGRKMNVGVATDIGHLTLDITNGLCGCDAVIVESNHDAGMLIDGPYPEYLKRRILSPVGHLSNASCSKLCTYLSEQGTKCVMLAHISKENNTRELAAGAVSDLSESGVRIVVSSDVTPACLYEE